MFDYIFLAALLGVVYADPEKISRSSLCPEKNGFHAVEGRCDSYIECKGYSASEMICPDGLHYNHQATWPEYPCGYPMDVKCQSRDAPQPAHPTAQCPHQFGFFPSPKADANHCGSYIMCVLGQAIEMQCPPGLAFNLDNGRCDWPDLVPSCNAEQFLGFQCPPAPLDADGHPLEVVNYEFQGSCYAFYSCLKGRPRFLLCDEGYAFEASSGMCVPESRVKCRMGNS